MNKGLREVEFRDWYPLVDNFRTFKWPRASDLEELVVESRT